MPSVNAEGLIKPALYMTLQGAKWSTFGEKRYKFAAGQARRRRRWTTWY
jgi:hypothetical protein